MLFKVYGQNIVRPKGMRIVEIYDVKPYLDEMFEQAAEAELVDIEDGAGVDEAYRKIKEWWDKNKNIALGDYYICETDDRTEIDIPSMVESDLNFIF